MTGRGKGMQMLMHVIDIDSSSTCRRLQGTPYALNLTAGDSFTVCAVHHGNKANALLGKCTRFLPEGWQELGAGIGKRRFHAPTPP